MVFLLQWLAPWLLAALALGLLVGVSGGGSERRSPWSVWNLLALALFAAGVVAATSSILPGRQGLQLESALALLSAYIPGYAAARAARRRFGRGAPAQEAQGEPTPAPAWRASTPTPRREPAEGKEPSPPDAAREDQRAAPAVEVARVVTVDAPTPREEILPPAASLANDALYPGERPPALRLAPLGVRDDLRVIAGLDAATEERLNLLGIWTCAQIAQWSQRHARWIGCYLADPGRVERENWVEQARARASGAGV